MSESVNWYWNRLKCMSHQEVLYRIEQAVFTRSQSLGLFRNGNLPLSDSSFKTEHSIDTCHDRVLIEDYVKEADRVLAGRLDIFNLLDKEYSFKDDWNRDPLKGIDAPLNFGKTLNYRDDSIVGDIKYLWEPNRHLHLVTIAQAYYLTNEQRYIDALEVQLNSWFDNCPYLLGPNWTSSLELAIRLINWSVVWQLIGGNESALFTGGDGEKLLERWHGSIHQHISFIKGHLSKYSSANNHLIGELAGLYVATTVWPYWSDCKKVQKKSMVMLEEQALLQNEIDGVNKEQAISYQQFVLDFLIISGLTARNNGQEFSTEYWKRIESMMGFLASIMDVGGNVPMIGDADDGYVVRLSQESDWCPYRSLLATGAILFNRGDFKYKAGRLDDKTRWLLGNEADFQYEKINVLSNSPVKRAFSSSGYYILGSDFEKNTEIKLIVDAGPLGYQSIAAHGHADALSFTLNLGGHEFLIDPGTYAYHTQKQWRDYFRGTSAHNTICIDGVDQSTSGGNFMWLRKANARCEHWDTNEFVDQFSGVHDGYMCLDDPVVHQRGLYLDKNERKIRVKDFIACKKWHQVEGFWHFSEACEVKNQGDGSLEILNDTHKMYMRMIGNRDIQYHLVRGDKKLPAGWVSRRYDIKEPCYTVIWHAQISKDSTFVTEIVCL